MKRDLAQLVVFAAWFVVLFRYQPLRALVRSAPRLETGLAAVLLAGWTLVQVTDTRSRFFPLISMYMYGERDTRTEVVAARMVVEGCDGHERVLTTPDLSGVPIRTRVQNMYVEFERAHTAADSARRGGLLDRTLAAVGRLYNQHHPDAPLCAVRLDRFGVPPDQSETGVIPAPKPVRHVALP